MKIKRILNVAGVLLLIALIVPFVIYAVPMTVGADHSFVVLTASMTPAIAPGDVVIVADRESTTIVEGDVITFTRGDNEIPVTHRVMTVVDSSEGLAFETKGDANGDSDASLVPAGNVVGMVILTIPYIGYVIQFTNTPYGFAAIVAGPIGLFVVSELWTLYRRHSGTDSSNTESVGTAATEETVDDAVGSKEVADGTDEFVITTHTLEGAFAPLVALVVYSGYTASVRLTELTIGVAVASTITLAALLILLVSARRRDEDVATPVETEPKRLESAQPTTDGGLGAESPDPAPSPGTDDEGVGQ